MRRDQETATLDGTSWAVRLEILVNHGTGLFGGRLAFAGTGKLPRVTAGADYHKDGNPDLAAANRDTLDVAVFRNGTAGTALPVPDAPDSSCWSDQG